jgi:predicted Zn-dependent protease
MAARHGTRPSKRALIPKLFVPAAQIATGFLTGGASSAGMYYSMNYGFQGLGGLLDRAFTGSSEKSQKEADQLGIQYTWKAGFDPRGYLAFIDSVASDKEAAKAAAFFGERSKFEKRIMDVFSEIQYLPPPEHPFADSVDFKMAKWSLAH